MSFLKRLCPVYSAKKTYQIVHIIYFIIVGLVVIIVELVIIRLDLQAVAFQL
jgi:hypothetical protein